MSTNGIPLLVFMILGLWAVPACGQTDGRIAPLLDGLGDHHHPITTNSPIAQRYFDQGLVLAYAFNHAEAERAFREALRRDSTCAMCSWGIAYALGPNINAAMEPEQAPKAYDAIQQALALAPRVTEKEQAYIDAMAKRYAAAAPEDRAPLDRAYVEAMRAVAQRYPDDTDAATLFAEGLMDTMPWDYWDKDGAPRPGTEDILSVLEDVVERDPRHPGANHLYIHVVEKVRPELGVGAADRLRDLVPGAGHLVHMPAHIYLRVGRYHDAVVANEKAIAADRAYITQCHAQGLYPIAYVPHNPHFLWAAATLAGQSAAAINAARRTAMHQDQHLMREPGYGTLQHYWVTPLYAFVRFGKWDEILAEPAPPEDLVYPTGVWHYARGIALTRKGRLEEAAQALGQLTGVAADASLEAVTIWDINTTAHLMRIAAETLTGELAAAHSDYEKALHHLKQAVALEDDLNYDEPPPWHYPVRQSLGAVLLEAGQAADAEQVYRDDLTRFPENGWSLFGLHRSLVAQAKNEQAQAVKKRFDKAWQYADVSLSASRF